MKSFLLILTILFLVSGVQMRSRFDLWVAAHKNPMDVQWETDYGSPEDLEVKTLQPSIQTAPSISPGSDIWGQPKNWWITIPQSVQESVTLPPETLKPVTLEPLTVEPVSLEPVVYEPVNLEPGNLEPIILEPVTLGPVNLEPVNLESVNLEPVNLEPVNLETVNLEPVNLESVNLEPVSLEPVNLEPMTLEPEILEIGTLEPVTLEPLPTEPRTLEPVTLEPEHINLETVALELEPLTTPSPINLPGDYDYCSLPCGKDHIGCKDNGLIPQPDCPKVLNYADMRITDLKDFIVDYHNKIRNAVAGGRVRNLPSASRMGTMRWDHELHVTASLKVRLCSTLHDNCHGTERFRYSGQNAGELTYAGNLNRLSIRDIVEDQLEHWVNGSIHCTRDMIRSFPVPLDNAIFVPDYGLFTLMARESNTHVGCAIHRYEKMHGYNRAIFVCHYATNNYKGSSIYKEGPAGSECKTGRNAQYPHLCSLEEKYYY